MKALVYHRYGGREVYALEDIAEPAAPGAGEVRVRVRATSINPVDGKVRRGELKLIAGRRFPKRPGLDFSGEIEAIGDRVTQFATGDQVYGAARSMSEGAFAERIVVRATSIARKPASLDHTTAAGVPTVGVAALQSLRDIVKVSKGDHILINGCTGGVGLFAIQLAKNMGATVTGVCSTDGVALARQTGADNVIDYKKTPMTPSGDCRAVLELSGKLPFRDAEGFLQHPGIYVDFSPTPAALIASAMTNPFRSHKRKFAMTSVNTADLDWLTEQIDAGSLRHAPTRVFPFDQYLDAFSVAESGGSIGKVVVDLSAGG